MTTAALQRPTLGPRTPSATSAPRGVVIALAAFLGVYLGWLALRWPPGEQAPIGDLFFLVIDTAAVYLSWRASERCPPSSRPRWFWRLMALALAGQMGGDLVTFVYDVGPGPIPFPSLADAPYLALYPLMFAALLCVPLTRGAGTRQARIALLDMATVILGGAMVIWLFALEPAITEGGESLLQTLVSVAYPVGDVVLLAGLAAVWLHWSPPAFRQTLILVAAGLLLFIVADVAYAYAVLHDEYTRRPARRKRCGPLSASGPRSNGTVSPTRTTLASPARSASAATPSTSRTPPPWSTGPIGPCTRRSETAATGSRRRASRPGRKY